MNPTRKLVPNNVVVNLLKHLDHETRLHAKLVCKEWHKILMTNHCFQENRQLCLLNSFIDEDRAPASVVLGSQYKFQAIKISCMTTRYIEWNQVEKFWSHLAKTVTSIRYTMENVKANQRIDEKTIKILSQFKHLRQLELVKCSIFHLLVVKEPNFKNVLKNIEVLKDDYCGIITAEYINLILNAFPKLKRIEMCVSSNDKVELDTMLIRKLGIANISRDDIGLAMTGIKAHIFRSNLLNVTNLRLEKSFDNQLQMQIKTETSASINISQTTAKDTIQIINNLSFLKNALSDIPNTKTAYLELANTFETDFILFLFFTRLVKLKAIHINNGKAMFKTGSFLTHIKEPLYNIRHLTITGYKGVVLNELRNLVNVFPHLRTFNMEYTHNMTLLDIITAIKPLLGQIQNLTLIPANGHTEGLGLDPVVFNQVQFIVNRYARKIRFLEIPGCIETYDELIAHRNLFETFDELAVVNFYHKTDVNKITRYEYLCKKLGLSR